MHVCAARAAGTMGDCGITVEQLRRLREQQVAGARRYDRIALGLSPVDEETGSNAGAHGVHDYRQRLHGRERLAVGVCCTFWLGCIVVGTAFAKPPVAHPNKGHHHHVHAAHAATAAGAARAAAAATNSSPSPLPHNETGVPRALRSQRASWPPAFESSRHWVNATTAPSMLLLWPPQLQRALTDPPAATRQAVKASDERSLWLAWGMFNIPADGRLLPHGWLLLEPHAQSHVLVLRGRVQPTDLELTLDCGRLGRAECSSVEALHNHLLSTAAPAVLCSTPRGAYGGMAAEEDGAAAEEDTRSSADRVDGLVGRSAGANASGVAASSREMDCGPHAFVAGAAVTVFAVGGSAWQGMPSMIMLSTLFETLSNAADEATDAAPEGSYNVWNLKEATAQQLEPSSL